MECIRRQFAEQNNQCDDKGQGECKFSIIWLTETKELSTTRATLYIRWQQTQMYTQWGIAAGYLTSVKI